MRKTTAQKGNPELIQALTEIEKEKDIDKEILFEAIENSLLAACKNQYGKADNVRVILDRKTGEFHVYLDKEGQNARLAARLTGYKIDIKSETQSLN